MAEENTRSRSIDFRLKNVSELQKYLKERGIIFSGFKKEDLVLLCQKSTELGLEFDPDDLLDSRADTIAVKLRHEHLGSFILPTLIGDASNDLSILPNITYFDIFMYLKQSDNHSNKTLRDFKSLEGYGMFKDVYVLDIQAGRQNIPHYFHVCFKVRPRTNSKDPTSGLPFYIGWIIFSARENEDRIFQAFCCCRGGIDGFCRHVTATLFEIVNFTVDESYESCTSKPCKWSHRKSNAKDAPEEVTELNPSMLDKKGQKRNYPHDRQTEVCFTSNPMDFMETLEKLHPEATALTAFKVIRSRQRPEDPAIDVLHPENKLKTFLKNHECSSSCECGTKFREGELRYSEDDADKIEIGTRGQHKNTNWFHFRKHFLTASNFKKIIHSTNWDNTAKTIYNSISSINDNFAPAPIKYGRKNEETARKVFIQGHRLSRDKKHSKCKILERVWLFPKKTLA